MNDNPNNDVWVFAEQRDGMLHPVSLELVGKARELAGDSSRVITVLLGHGVRELLDLLISHGADVVHVADNPALKDYRLLAYTTVLTDLIRKHNPNILLMGATPTGTELAPRVAARLGTGLSAHCIDLKIDPEGQLLQVVPGWGGGVLGTIACPHHRPQMATVMPGTMQAHPPRSRDGEIREMQVFLVPDDLGPEIIDTVRECRQGLPIEKAEVVVAGGYGIGDAENWKMLDELAGLLGGAVGGTRPPVDEGWIEESMMIGQSGKTVRPKLYLGIGISGAMHHVVGMDKSEHIITINTDVNAAIADTSDTIVVEDFKKILPLLIDKLKMIKEDQCA